MYNTIWAPVLRELLSCTAKLNASAKLSTILMKVWVQSRTGANSQLPLLAGHGIANAVHTCPSGHSYTLIINKVPQVYLINEVSNSTSRPQTWHCLNNNISCNSKQWIYIPESSLIIPWSPHHEQEATTIHGVLIFYIHM